MKKLLFLSVTLLFAATSFAATQVGPQPAPLPTILDSGGPDTYGYRWTDNDGGGGPTYNWIDISGIGVHVTDLADDNNVGPVPFGFTFPYYWYGVDHMWIGSNGYISFSYRTNFAHPFDVIPSVRVPNDLVAVLTGDLDFTDTSHTRTPACYYYSNNVDTFIVSWINVSEFSSDHSFRDSTHTFQLILAKRDSSLTFQYGENHGLFPSSGNLADLIGIENVVGQVGIQYLHNNTPANHLWHSGLALKFTVIPNPSFTFHDVGVLDGFHDGSGADFVHIGNPYTIRGIIKNFGTAGENNITLRCQVRRGTTIIYTHTDTVAHMDPAQVLTVDFDPAFTPDTIFMFKVTFTSTLTGDQNASNNTKTVELDSYRLPQQLRYDDDLADAGRSWNGNFSGFGLEFQVPEPVQITQASMNIYTADSTAPAALWVVPDDGNGHPNLGNLLFDDTITINSGVTGWYDVDLSSHNISFAANERFYIVEIHVRENTMQFGMDKTASNPLSYRGWEFTSGLSPDRERDSSDVMIKVMAITHTGINEEITPKSFSLSQNYPNPFNAQTNIRFTLVRPSDVSINIYNIVGQLVTNISGHYNAGANQVNWNASEVSSGVYFYRINVGSSTETRKMVLLK
jgi:hypothetical protein